MLGEAPVLTTEQETSVREDGQKTSLQGSKQHELKEFTFCAKKEIWRCSLLILQTGMNKPPNQPISQNTMTESKERWFFLFGMEINGCIGLHSTVQKAWISGSGCLLHSIKDLHICQLLTLKRLTVHLDFIQFGANLNLLSFACWTAEIRMNCSKATWCSSFKSRIRKLLQKDFSLPSVQMKLSCPSPWASLPPAAAREALPFSILLWRQSFLSAAVLGQPTPPQDTSLSSDLHLDSQQRETYSKRFSWPNYKAGFCFLPL